MKPDQMTPLDYILWGISDRRRVLWDYTATEDMTIPKEDYQRLIRTARSARAVQFDYESSMFVGQLADDIEKLAYYSQWAACPFPNMVVHLNADGWVDGIGRDKSQMPDEDGVVWMVQQKRGNPQRFVGSGLMPMRGDFQIRGKNGVFIEPGAYELETGDGYLRRDSICVPYIREALETYFEERVYPHLDREHNEAAFMRTLEADRDRIDLMMLGTGYFPTIRAKRRGEDSRDVIHFNRWMRMPDRWKTYESVEYDPGEIETLRRLGSRMTPVLSPFMETRNAPPKLLQLASKYHADEMANLIGAGRQLLATMTVLGMRHKNPSLGSVEVSPRSSKIVQGKRYVKPETQTLTINLLEAHRAIQQVPRGLWKNRRHSVIGHWVHYWTTGDRLCRHEWHTNPEPDAHGRIKATRQVCSRCGMKRTWKNAHERGSEELGWVGQKKVRVVAHDPTDTR